MPSDGLYGPQSASTGLRVEHRPGPEKSPYRPSSRTASSPARQRLSCGRRRFDHAYWRGPRRQITPADVAVCCGTGRRERVARHRGGGRRGGRGRVGLSGRRRPAGRDAADATRFPVSGPEKSRHRPSSLARFTARQRARDARRACGHRRPRRSRYTSPRPGALSPPPAPLRHREVRNRSSHR